MVDCQEGFQKASDDSQSMDYEFIENLFNKQLSNEANIHVSPEEVAVYLKLPITSSQVAAPKQEQVYQAHLEDLNDVSYIIMSPTTPDKADITIDSESEKYNTTADQLLLAHEKEVPLNATQMSVIHAAIKTEETKFNDDVTLCGDQGQHEEIWNFMNEILSCQKAMGTWRSGCGPDEGDDRWTT